MHVSLNRKCFVYHEDGIYCLTVPDNMKELRYDMTKSDRKSNKVSKCKLKKDLFGNKTKEIRYSMAIANSPLVA